MSPKQQSILLGGLVAGVLSTSYLGVINLLCCAGVLIGAITSVWHYTSNTDDVVESGDGAVMGAGAGVVAVLVTTVLTYAIINPLGLGMEEGMMSFVQNYADLSEDQLQQMQAQQEQSQSPLMIAIGLGFSLVLYSVFGAIGGAIGAAVFGGEEEG